MFRNIAGTAPSTNSFEDERRLFYVAVTRAKHDLYLMKPDHVWQRAYSYEGGYFGA